jgi:hypothetical protein
MIVLGTTAAILKSVGHFGFVKGYHIAKIPLSSLKDNRKPRFIDIGQKIKILGTAAAIFKMAAILHFLSSKY